MEEDFVKPANELEEAIAAVGPPGEDEDFTRRRRVLARLATGAVTVLLKEPWTETNVPGPDAEPMYVSDYGDTERPMLAVFTNADRALAFEHRHGGFEHPCTVPGLWAIAAPVAGAGIMVNPNEALGFRIARDLLEVLRKDVAQAKERALERARSEGAPT